MIRKGINMNYTSTRGLDEKVTSAYAIKKGIAPDGGLYMPTEIPSITLDEIKELSALPYYLRAADILGRFLPDYDKAVLTEDCKKAYSEDNFKGGAAPVYKLKDDCYVLELFHGPTCAFKDMALQIMPSLLSRALDITGEKDDAYILVATSGDTGKAALEGYADKDRIKIKVFYPSDGVSKMQKRQMATQTGANVSVCAIQGNFDDAQNGVKKIFADKAVNEKLAEKGLFLSSANSINWGRLAPQIVYYISAYADLVAMGELKLGDTLDVTVPTGNFGNIFAAYIAKCMGLPIGKLVCASNKNNILTDFLSTGTYDRNREFYQTISPSMDILISSNLERLLYLLCGSEKTAEYMKKLNTEGKYEISVSELEAVKNAFAAGCTDEAQTKEEIKKTFGEYGYLIDTHTAVALRVAEEYREKNGGKMLTVSTASPYKFAADVLDAVKGKFGGDEFETLDELSAVSGVAIPDPLACLKTKEIRFTKIIDCADMAKEVLNG